MTTQYDYKQIVKGAREIIEAEPNKSAAELAQLVSEQMIYPNRSNEKMIKEMLFHVSAALELVLAHPNSLDGVLSRKLEEKVLERHQQLLADPQLFAEKSVLFIAHSMSQLLQMKEQVGDIDATTWRGLGDQMIENPELQGSLSEKSIEEFGEIFMNIRNMTPQDGFAYIVDNISPEHNTSLYNDISVAPKASTQAAKL